MNARGKCFATVPLNSDGSIASDLPCTSCEANLRGRDLEGTCPECSAPVVQSVPTIPLDVDGRIAGDVPCLRCTYNLRGLDPTGTCPECGTPVPLSTQRTLLRFAPPGWVRRLAWGALLLAAGIALALLLLATATGLHRFFGPTALAVRIMSAIGGHVALVPIVLTGLGLFLISSRDPSQLYSRQGWTSRRILQYCLWITLVLTLLLGSLAGRPYGTWKFRLQVIALLALYVVLTALWVALMRHLTNLLRRVPQPRMSSEARTLIWPVPALSVLTIAYSAACLMPSRPTWAWMSGAMRNLDVLLQIAWPTFALWILILLIRAQRQLARVAKEARAIARLDSLTTNRSSSDDANRD